MPERSDPERDLARTADELEERRDRLDSRLDEARELLAERAREARGLGQLAASEAADDLGQQPMLDRP